MDFYRGLRKVFGDRLSGGGVEREGEGEGGSC